MISRASRVYTPIPQPKLRPLVGHLPELDGDHLIQSLMRLGHELGPIYRLTLPTRGTLVIGSHALVDEVSDETRFDKLLSGPLVQIRDFAGDGLFTSRTDEPNWGRAHRILMPAFGPGAMRGYFDAMVDIADQMLTKWERLGADVDLDVTDNMTRLTLDTIALCGFGYRFNSFYQREMHPFVEAMVRSLAEAGGRSRRLPLQTRLMLMTQRQYSEDIAYMNGIVDELIAERRRNPDDQARDLLGLMLAGRDPQTGEGLDDVNVRYQMVTFLIAGHETTSGLLSFTTYQLLEHPEVLARVQRELDEVLDGQPPRFEQMPELVYLDQVLRESLRLWPTAPAYALYPKQDVVLDGRYEVAAGEQITVLTPMLHRDPAVWGDDVETFDPERFAPGRREQLPVNAWKPFGHGQRACIGRPFAMQEAALALAMMLQRFDLTLKPGYQLQVKETLTLKPEGLTVRAKAKAPGARHVPTAKVATPPPLPPAPLGEGAHATPLLVLFGSNSGSSEAFARRVAGDALGRGYAATVAPLDDYAGKLPTTGALFVVTASYNGAPPDNARRFCEWLDSVPAGALRGLRYTVFGCGNRDWAATYQAIPARIDERLAAAGAERLTARGEADARADFFGDFEAWYAPATVAIDRAFDVTTQAATGALYEIERVDSGSDALCAQHGVTRATVLENRELVDMTSPLGRSKRHLQLQLPDGMRYRTGDYLVVLPENDAAQVERAARRFRLATDRIVQLHATRAGAASLPTDRAITVGELLTRHVELATPATRQQVGALAKATQCPPEKLRLQALADDTDKYRTHILEKRVSVLDLLDEFMACELSFAAFLEMVPAMRPRQYSISSSPLAGATKCTLTVAVVDAPAWSGRGRYRGTASGHLARLQPGDTVAVSVRAPNTPFHPPADRMTPMILVAAGSGMAPFRGFVEERALGTGPAAETLLFFGCDHPDVDLLYRDELAGWQAQGVVELLPAFFRQPAGDVMFVQHRLWKERARVQALIERGAVVFVCGDGARMAPAVRETLARIRQDATGCSDDEAGRWLDERERQGQYVADVFT